MAEGGGGFLASENAIDVVRGTSRTLVLTVQDSHGDVVDLTSARVVFSVKCKTSDTTPIIQKDSDVGVGEAEITDPTQGEAKIYLQPTDTQNMTPGKYIFDVWVILTGGSRHLVVGPGSFNVKAGVTVIPL